MQEKEKLTFSAINCWRNCPRKYKHRYIDGLRPKEKADTLAFGSLIHEALEFWYRNAVDDNRLFKVFDLIDSRVPERECDPVQKNLWCHAKAMFAGYATVYPADDFQIVEIEKEFTGEIRNPATGAASQTFTIAGKVDGIVRCHDGLYLLEHKTASTVDASYLDKLWCDTQIALYTNYLREQGYPIIGVIYNVLLKSRLKQKSGETDEEFAARRAVLASKNKSGKTTAKQQETETDEDFQARLYDWYSKPEAFHREKIYLTEDRLAMVLEEVWEVTQQYLGAKRRDSFLMNTSYCFNWSRPCEYLPYCQSCFNPIVRDNLFEVTEPHEELSSADTGF